MVGDRPGAAVATFTGYVRDHSDERPVGTLELEHYPEMAQRVLAELGEEAASRYGLSRWRIVHRFGVLGVSESIVWVGAVADHRGDAISACELIMDSLKTDAPFWKREEGRVVPSGWQAEPAMLSASAVARRGAGMKFCSQCGASVTYRLAPMRIVSDTSAMPAIPFTTSTPR